jgi:hypothetical protein
MSDPSHDPNMNRSYRRDSSAGMWAGILLAAFVIVIGLILLMPKGADTVATSPGAGTTGSGTQSAPSSPGGTRTNPGTSGSGTAPSR